MSTVRLRRLAADHEKLQDYVRRHPRVKLLQSRGDPPEQFQLQYRILSLRQVGGELQPVKDHTVEISLPRNYPRTPPQCRMLTPVFHPNIAPHAICVGDHWSAGESLQSIVTRIGEMLAYQSYNVKSPLNGEAARWVEENKERLPLDPVSLLVEEQDSDEPSGPLVASPSPGARATSSPPPLPPASQTSPPARAVTSHSSPPQPTPAIARSAVLELTCPECAAFYRIPREFQGRKVRCEHCRHVFMAPSSD